MIERVTGRVKFIVIENLSAETINEIIVQHTDGPILAYTDDYRVYDRLSSLPMVIDHRRVNHSAGVFAEGKDHINTAEGVHSRLRVFLRVHRGPNRQNLQLYVSFFAYYHNSGRDWLEKVVRANSRRPDRRPVNT